MSQMDWMRMMLCGLGGAVLSMASFWMVEARHYVDRQEVVDILESQAPYVRDRALIMNLIDANTAANKQLAEEVDELGQILTEFRVQLGSSRP